MSGPSSEDQQAARDLWVELGRHEMAYATPEQLLQFMRRCPETVGLDLAAKMLATQERAAHCWVADHVGRLEDAETRLAAMPDAIATARTEGYGEGRDDEADGLPRRYDS